MTKVSTWLEGMAKEKRGPTMGTPTHDGRRTTYVPPVILAVQEDNSTQEDLPYFNFFGFCISVQFPIPISK